MKPVLVAMLLALWSCDGAKPASPPLALAPSPGPSSVPGRTLGPPQPPPRAFQESLLHGKEFLLETPPTPVDVADPWVGPLSRDSEATQVVSTFLSQAAAGALDPGILDPRWADYLTAWAQRALAAGFRSGLVHLGTQISDGSDPSDGSDGEIFPVHVIEEPQDWVGWVVLTRNAGRYGVSDVRLNPRAGPSGPVDPEAPAPGQPISRPSRL